MGVSTADRAPVMAAFRLRLLLQPPASGAPTLALRLSGGLHTGTPPDNAPYPYGYLRLINVRRRAVDGPFYRGDVVLDLFDRPRANDAALKAATDVAVEAVVGWDDLSVGITQVELRDSDDVRPFSEHADPEVIRTTTTFTVDFNPPPT